MSATRLPDDDPDVVDMHVARILAMSHEEVRAEIISRGEDPDTVVAQMRIEFDAAIARHKASHR